MVQTRDLGAVSLAGDEGIMTIARILVNQGSITYRFLKFDSRPDGTLLVFVDRDQCPTPGSTTTPQDGANSPSNDSIRGVTDGKISCHTTGEVRYYFGGTLNKKIYIEPLHQLSKLYVLGFFSVPSVPRLDSLGRTTALPRPFCDIGYPPGNRGKNNVCSRTGTWFACRFW